MYKPIFYFDIFDTCVVRSCGRSDNVYFLLAETILDTRDETILRAFVEARKVAEKMAEKELGKEAVNIDEIYNFFNTAFFTHIPKRFIRDKEIEIDLQSLCPVKSMMQRLDACRQKGKVIFISDMYLPDDMLRDALLKIGIIKDEEPLYISGTVGLTKRSGHLFEYVKEKENVDVKKWVHCGDHPIGDNQTPKKLGISVKPICHLFSSYEKKWENETRLFGRTPISLFAGIIRSVRLSHYCGNDDAFVPDVMASLLIPFVLSVLNDAKKKKLERLYFAARDGYLLYKIAKTFQNVFPDIEFRYLQISTKVLYPLYIHEGTAEEVRTLLDTLPGFKPMSVLDMLDYSEDDKKDIGRVIDLEQSVRGTELFLADMIEKMVEGNRGQMLRDRCKTKRNILETYLTQEGFKSNKSVGLVDIGWRCTSQHILGILGIQNVSYYYFGTSPYRLPIEKTGSFVSYIYGEETKNSIYPLIIEFYMCRTICGTTIGYAKTDDGLIQPVKERENLMPTYIEEVKRNEQIVLDVAEKCKNYMSVVEHSEQILRTCSLRSLIEFSERPTYQLIKTIAPSLNYLHFNLKKPVIVKYYPWTYVKFKLNRTLFTFEYSKFWLYGSLVYTYRKIGEKLIKML